MSDLNASAANDVLATASAAKADAADAFSRALGPTISIEIDAGSPLTETTIDTEPDLSGPGLVMSIGLGGVGALVLLPAAGDLLPDWCREPDATGKSKLNSLSQELGMILLPERFFAETFKAAWVANLATAVKQAKLAAESARLKLNLTADSKKSAGTFVFPCETPDAALEVSAAPTAPAQAAAPPEAAAPVASPATANAAPTPKATAPAATSQLGGVPAAPTSIGSTSPIPAVASAAPPPAAPETSSPKHVIKYNGLEDGLRQLPPYTQSLMRIKVPVVVTLAETKQSIDRIVNMGPGSILQFTKACDESLTLEVGSTRLALGEAVKVGEKFGLWITAIVLPEERFGPAQSMVLKGQAESA